jgi:iron complex transport system ATP-binding protein
VQYPNSLMARWTTKALTRKGYRISPEAPVELIVDEEQKCWIITRDGKSVVAHSIGDALQQISDFRTC